VSIAACGSMAFEHLNPEPEETLLRLRMTKILIGGRLKLMESPLRSLQFSEIFVKAVCWQLPGRA
jgi:hypothetical protein